MSGSDAGLFQSTEEADAKILAAVADRVVRMSMTVPAVFFLESTKPLSFVGSQALIFFEPYVKAFLPFPDYQRFAVLMEDRNNLEKLIVEIERRDAEWTAEQRAARARAKAEKEPDPRPRWRRWLGP